MSQLMAKLMFMINCECYFVLYRGVVDCLCVRAHIPFCLLYKPIETNKYIIINKYYFILKKLNKVPRQRDRYGYYSRLLRGF